MTALVVPPAGWTGGASPELVEQTGRVGHFGGVHGVIEAERYDGPSLVLYVTRVSATTSDVGDAAAAEIGVLGHPVTARSVEGKAIVASSAWSDGDVHGTARLVIAATGDRIVAVKGECYAGAAAGADATAACAKALTTLDPGITPGERIEIPPPSGVPAVPQLTTPGPGATHVALPPIAVKQEVQTDRRPVYVGAGLIVIAAIFWWNRKRAAHDR